jgi:hypothetical protein
MDRPVRYHPLFDCDVREAAGWYDRRSAGLGDAFVEAPGRWASLNETVFPAFSRTPHNLVIAGFSVLVPLDPAYNPLTKCDLHPS